ncbi:hypothetical protein LCGC14_2138110 [marine sediment metagenome]|uniref:Uncharacterized protein n=1 Tax=marine sediment metagenome TaxID=412755 RepID=A0A0F9ELF4_9ZZZZ
MDKKKQHAAEYLLDHWLHQLKKEYGFNIVKHDIKFMGLYADEPSMLTTYSNEIIALRKLLAAVVDAGSVQYHKPNGALLFTTKGIVIDAIVKHVHNSSWYKDSASH